jgi:hypothetical protein
MAKADKAKRRRSRTLKTGGQKKKASTMNISKGKVGKTKAAQKGIVPLTPEFVNDLKEVFAKHNWSGHPIGFVVNPVAASLSTQACDPGPATCPDGSQPQQQWVHCPDGTSILRNFCP